MHKSDEHALEYFESLILRRVALDTKLSEMGKPKNRREKRLFFKPIIKERNFLRGRAQSYVPTLLDAGFDRKTIIEVVSRTTKEKPPVTGQLIVV